MPGTCSVHPDRPIRGVCANCGRPACDECLVEIAGISYCKSCLEAKMKGPPRRIHGFVRLVLSVLPGVGHLYMGLMNRGFQIMLATLAGAFVGGMIFPPIAGFWVAVLVFYSIFDAREAHRASSKAWRSGTTPCWTGGPTSATSGSAMPWWPSASWCFLTR